jgi:hypothetical protein
MEAISEEGNPNLRQYEFVALLVLFALFAGKFGFCGSGPIPESHF